MLKRQSEQFYEQAAKEVHENNMRPGIYAKAFADAQADKGKAVALYVKYRVEHLETELSDAVKKEKQKFSEQERRRLRQLGAGIDRWIRQTKLILISFSIVLIATLILSKMQFSLMFSLGYATSIFSISSIAALPVTAIVFLIKKDDRLIKERGLPLTWYIHFSNTLPWVLMVISVWLLSNDVALSL